jgi:hypothetical protein
VIEVDGGVTLVLARLHSGIEAAGPFL